MRELKRALTLLVVAALTLMGCSDSDDDKPAGLGGASTDRVWSPRSGLPFAEPIQIPEVRDPAVKDVSVTLDVTRQSIKVSGDVLTALPFQATDNASGKKYDAQINGPTLHVGQGGTIRITFNNNSGQDTNIHYHGLHVSPERESDNVFQVFKTGTSRQSVVHIPTNHPVGSYWYHVHLHGISESQVNGGLSGMLIVEGIEKTLNSELQSVPQRQIAIREVATFNDAVPDKSTTTTTLAGTTTTTLPNASKTTVLVNGLLEPSVTLTENQYEIWRFVNLGVNKAYKIPLPPGIDAWVLGEDGNPVFDQTKLTPLLGGVVMPLPAGKRFDVLIYPNEATETPIQLAGGVSGTPVLASINVNAKSATALLPLEPAAVDTDLSALPDDGLRVTRLGQTVDFERTITFNLSAAGATVQGDWTGLDAGGYLSFPAQTFSPDRTDVGVRLGTLERWTILNVSPAVHPFHIHVNEFEVESIEAGGQPLLDQTFGTADVIEVPAQAPGVDGKPVPGKVVLLNRYLDFNGHFVFHCHILNHEDRGMMAVIQVLGPRDVPSPPPHDTTGAIHGRMTIG